VYLGRLHERRVWTRVPIFGMILRLCTIRQTARFDIAARCSPSVGSVEKGYCIIRDSVTCSVLSYRKTTAILDAPIPLLKCRSYIQHTRAAWDCHENQYAMRVRPVMVTFLPIASLVSGHDAV
jgi:hypothetical protein